MITGTRDVRIEDRARAEGAKDFLYKPFFAKDIDAVLNRLFGLSVRDGTERGASARRRLLAGDLDA